MGNQVSSRDIAGVAASFVPVLSTVTGTIQAFHYHSKVKNLDARIAQLEVQKTAGKVNDTTIKLLKKEQSYCKKLFIASIFHTIPVVNIVAGIYSAVILSKLDKLDTHPKANKTEKNQPVADAPNTDKLKSLRNRIVNLQENLNKNYETNYQKERNDKNFIYSVRDRQFTESKEHPYINVFWNLQEKQNVYTEKYRKDQDDYSSKVMDICGKFDALKELVNKPGNHSKEIQTLEASLEKSLKEIENKEYPKYNFEGFNLTWEDVQSGAYAINPKLHTEAKFNEVMDFIKNNRPQ